MMEALGRIGSVTVCLGMALAYVGTLHLPTWTSRFLPPTSFHDMLFQRFMLATAASFLCFLLSFLFLFPTSLTSASNLTDIFAAYGVRADHFWRAVVCSFSLTCLMYTGSLLHKCLALLELQTWTAAGSHICAFILSLPSDIIAWRNLVVAPITEELVFRACMIPLLLCGGFTPLTTAFLCPFFFSLAHLSHLFEFGDYNIRKRLTIVGTQLVYTLIFGSYASFLFIRTGHLVAPLIAHVVCNFMGLPVVYSKRGLVVSLAFIAGAIGFFRLLIPLTVPSLYNSRTDECRCWQGYCTTS